MLFTGSVVVPWSLVRWLVGCWLFLFGLSLRFWDPGLQLGMFALSRLFGAWCFLLFTLALQGWSPVPTVEAILLLLLSLLLLFGRFTVFRPCTLEWTSYSYDSNASTSPFFK
jgi:hypothetical protein